MSIPAAHCCYRAGRDRRVTRSYADSGLAELACRRVRHAQAECLRYMHYATMAPFLGNQCCRRATPSRMPTPWDLIIPWRLCKPARAIARTILTSNRGSHRFLCNQPNRPCFFACRGRWDCHLNDSNDSRPTNVYPGDAAPVNRAIVRVSVIWPIVAAPRRLNGSHRAGPRLQWHLRIQIFASDDQTAKTVVKLSPLRV
jgi:hypothetical protein